MTADPHGPFALQLLPWEKYWQNAADLDFMRGDPDEANHPIRVRMGNEAQRIAENFNNPESKPRVLDVGCGTGIDYPRLKSLGFEYWGIDPIPKFIDRARELHPDIKILQGRVWDIPFEDKTFDVVWMKGVVQHLPPGTYPEALDEAWRVTKSLLMVSTNRSFYRRGRTHRLKGGAYYNHYNFEEFNGHIQNLRSSVSKHIKGFVKKRGFEDEEAIKQGFVQTLFLIYNADYWREHYATD